MKTRPTKAFCGRCKHYKDKAQFHKDNSRPNGVRGQCKKCWNTTMREWNAARRKANTKPKGSHTA